MENLPDDIFIDHLYPLLYNNSINLGLTCKRLYELYLYKINRNPLIAKRYERVTNKFNECNRDNGSLGIIFDRMYKLHAYHESTFLMIFVKAYQPEYTSITDIDLFLHYTTDEWQTVKREKLKFVNYIARCKIRESTWIIYFDSYSNYLKKIWFAIELISKFNEHTWDNNNGWNYDTSREH